MLVHGEGCTRAADGVWSKADPAPVHASHATALPPLCLPGSERTPQSRHERWRDWDPAPGPGERRIQRPPNADRAHARGRVSLAPAAKVGRVQWPARLLLASVGPTRD